MTAQQRASGPTPAPITRMSQGQDQAAPSMAVVDGLTFFQLLHQLMAGSRQTPHFRLRAKTKSHHQEQETFIKVGKGHRMPPSFPPTIDGCQIFQPSERKATRAIRLLKQKPESRILRFCFFITFDHPPWARACSSPCSRSPQSLTDSRKEEAIERQDNTDNPADSRCHHNVPIASRG